jgi:hypothetical protein
MKLDALRKEDEIRTRTKVAPTMQHVFQQAQPCPNSRDVTSTPWPVFQPPKPQSTPSWGAQVKVAFRDISGLQSKYKMAFVRTRRDGDNWDRDATQVFGAAILQDVGRFEGDSCRS